MRQTMRECVRYYNTQKPGKRWYIKKNPQSQWIAGFLFVVREAGLEPARPEWSLEPESHYGLPPSVGAGLAIANPFISAHVSPLLFSFDADPCVI